MIFREKGKRLEGNWFEQSMILSLSLSLSLSIQHHSVHNDDEVQTCH